jgi:iron complex outermembrane receptor protein
MGLCALLSHTCVAASYLDSFLVCTTITFSTPTTTVPAGSRTPGVPHQSAYAELAWHNAAGRFAVLEARAESGAYPNDVNCECAPGYTVARLRAGLEQRAGAWQIKEFAHLDHLLNRNDIGAIIVDDSNSRYCEPAPHRNGMIGVAHVPVSDMGEAVAVK